MYFHCSEESEDNEKDEENNDKCSDSEQDYSIGIRNFLEKVKSCTINVQKKIIACATFQKVTTFQHP